MAATLWHIIGVVGGIIFYSRFYVQWLATEAKKRSVVPVIFWYQSSIGTLMLLPYAVFTQSPVGALGQGFNILIYGRNLVHIWREKGKLTRARNITLHCIMALVIALAAVLVAWVWLSEYRATKDVSSEVATKTWFWLAVGVAGNVLFALRFIVQWIATEAKRKSVIPNSFWYISIIASLLQLGCFLQRADWVFAIGMLTNILVYFRNLWFIHGSSNGE